MSTRIVSRRTLSRRESAAYRELCEIFRTMQRMDRAGCSTETYLEIAAQYRAASEAHFAALAAYRAYDDDGPEPPTPGGPAALPVVMSGRLAA
jgi:hypothetical protein